MKYLRINKGKGEFLKQKDRASYSSITEMINIDVYNLLLWIGDDDNPEFDEEVSKVNNDAERIVYETLVKNFLTSLKKVRNKGSDRWSFQTTRRQVFMKRYRVNVKRIEGIKIE